MNEFRAQVRNADFLFGSHDHMDHIHDDTLRAAAAASPGAKVVLPAGLAESVAARIGLAPERILPVADGRRAETDGVRITGIGGHSRKGRVYVEMEIYR